MFSKNKKILVVAAHPDDEILGCGGAVARLIKEGCTAYTMLLGEGITSRDKKRDRKKRKKEIMQLRRLATLANEAIGVSKILFYDFPDNRFDTVPILDIIKTIEEVKEKIKPDVIFTHSVIDLNIDHKITYSAVLTACRPIKNESVKEIYSFEIPSSTEWNYPNVFNPNIFIDTSDTVEIKIQALKCYKTEIRDFPHPRSEASVRNFAKRWGNMVGLDCAEAFEVIRSIV